MCKWNFASLISVRAHLAKKHSIEIQAGEIWAKSYKIYFLTNYLPPYILKLYIYCIKVNTEIYFYNFTIHYLYLTFYII